MELIVEIEKQLPDYQLEVSFRTQAEPLGILGASGSGKSMTLRCIAGLATPDRGRIVLNNRVLFDSAQRINLPSQERRVGFLFQHYALFPHLNIRENILFGCTKERRSECPTLADELLEAVNLTGLAARYPAELSGGQQQRVALARVLAVQPEVLLLDEPFSALDYYLRAQLEKQLLDILQDFQGITLFVTHNLEEVYHVCQDLIILFEGKKIAAGAKTTIFTEPPTYEAALLTGCQNLSTLRILDAHLIQAPEWGCLLQLSKPVGKDAKHVGIRAHHLRLTTDPNLPNTYPCWVVQTAPAPHRVTLYLSVQQPQVSPSVPLLRMEVSQEKWLDLQHQPQPWLLQLPPEHLFVTS